MGCHCLLFNLAHWLACFFLNATAFFKNFDLNKVYSSYIEVGGWFQIYKELYQIKCLVLSVIKCLLEILSSLGCIYVNLPHRTETFNSEFSKIRIISLQGCDIYLKSKPMFGLR